MWGPIARVPAVAPRRRIEGWSATSSGAGLVVLGLTTALVAALSATFLGPTALWLLVAGGIAALLIRHPPVLLSGFLFVPWFKSLPVFGMLPIDATLALSILVLGVCAYRFATGRSREIPVGFVAPIAAVGVALAIGYLWTASPEYGAQKVIQFFTLTLLAAVAPFFLLRTRRDVQTFGLAIALPAVLVAGLTPFNEATTVPGLMTQTSLEGRLAFGGQIYPSRFLCTGALILFFLPTFTGHRLRYVGPILGLGVLGVAIGIGSRGPVVALGVSLAAVMVLSIMRGSRPLLLTAITVGSIVALFPLVSLPDTARERIATTVSDPVSVLEGDSRSDLYEKALELTSANPLVGAGTGSYATYSSTLSKFEILYPHNIFLELSSEVGVVPPLIALIPMVVGSVLLLRRARTTKARDDRQLLYVLLGLFLFALSSTQFSGDINDNRSMWTFLAILWLVSRTDLVAPLRPEPRTTAVS